MITSSFNQADLDRVKNRLGKLQHITTDLKNPDNPIYQYKISLLFTYMDAVIKAMGSVDVVDYGGKNNFAKNYHGNVAINLQGLGIRQVSWKNLSSATIDYKRAMGYRMKIWEASGQAQAAVKIHQEDGFVGLTPEDGEAYEHAIKTEFGGAKSEDGTNLWERRGLFTVANDIVMSQADAITDRIRTIILTYVSWGS